jgi:hypothetical protein
MTHDEMESAIVELQNQANADRQILMRLICRFPIPLHKRIYNNVLAFFRRLRTKELKRAVLNSGIEIVHR